MTRRVLVVAVAVALSALGPAASAPVTLFHHPIVAVGANKSNNWSGYNQGTLEQGGKLFHGVSGGWIVPTATQHKKKQAEYSSTWVGIGGGCIDAKCRVTDGTLIQAGTEQDVNSSGKASYHAWWELIPAPSVQITSFPVHAGDHVRVSISEVTANSNVWRLVVKNLSTKKSRTVTTPYASTHATAEWIEETPVVIDDSGNVTVGPLPNLSAVHFDLGKTNGASAHFRSAERMQLVDFNNHVLATPSGPDGDLDGFNDCTYSSTCRAPATS